MRSRTMLIKRSDDGDFGLRQNLYEFCSDAEFPRYQFFVEEHCLIEYDQAVAHILSTRRCFPQ